MRLFVSYFIEEMGEILLAEEDERTEEAADALHFIVELCIRTATDVGPEPLRTNVTSFHVLNQAAQFLHQLKLKPWKKTWIPASEIHIKRELKALFHTYLGFCTSSLGITQHELYEAYFAKAKVNHQRIESGV